MKSDGGSVLLGALMVLLLTLCGAGGFFAFWLKMSDTSMPELLGQELDLTGLLWKIAGLLVLTILSQLASIWIARALKKPVHVFFSSRWLPKDETYTTEPGERLERVVSQSFAATTAWELITETVPAVCVVSFIIWIVVLVAGPLGNQSVVFLGYCALPLANLVMISWSYWIKDWSREYTKFVIFTTVTFYVRVRTPVFALLTGLGNLPKVSKTPIDQLQEIQSSADPEDFDPNFKTGWIRDQFISWLAKRFGTRTLFLRSRSNLAEDTLFWVDHGPGIVRILNMLIKNVQEFSKTQDKVAQNVSNILAGDADDHTWSKRRAKVMAARYRNEVMQSVKSEEPKPYNLFRVQDPGLYDDNGNELQPTSDNTLVHLGDVDQEPESTESVDLDVRSAVPGETHVNGEDRKNPYKDFEL